MVRDCFDHRHQSHYPACYGILWGYDFHKGMYHNKSQFQVHLSMAYMDLEATEHPHEPTLMGRDRTNLYERMQNTKRKEAKLREQAYHCYTFHTWDTSDPHCNGISFGHIENFNSMTVENQMLQIYIDELVFGKQ